ncbi:hypothetical protein TIFTF001_002707 [Ficus carica]|uniref:Uncharacterized protein n=1 Tax=Ficus carica TaxID=3494 RepID=A0AA88CSR1_FICCA|nr:hypothetical protein TIFTF001_002707 [Ficus carica]
MTGRNSRSIKLAKSPAEPASSESRSLCRIPPDLAKIEPPRTRQLVTAMICGRSASDLRRGEKQMDELRIWLGDRWGGERESHAGDRSTRRGREWSWQSAIARMEHGAWSQASDMEPAPIGWGRAGIWRGRAAGERRREREGVTRGRQAGGGLPSERGEERERGREKEWGVAGIGRPGLRLVVVGRRWVAGDG